MISISGNILSAIIDEANSCPPHSIQQGILFGSKSCRRTEVQSDTQEDKVVDEYLVGITSYINLRTRHSFWSESNKINIPDILVDRDDIVGLLVIRRDGMKNPSIRDLAVASYLSHREISAMYPFLILVISVGSDQSSWVFGMNFVCHGLFAHSPMTLYPLEMKIPSLSADSTADYKAAQCLNYDSVISRNIGDKSSALLSYAAASSIQQSVEAEMLAAQLIDDIQDTALEVAALDSEVSKLRMRLADASE